MHALTIVVLCIGMAITYGILHDQVTARVCVEYFTIGHEPIFGTDSPTLLGLGWHHRDVVGWPFAWDAACSGGARRSAAEANGRVAAVSH